MEIKEVDTLLVDRGAEVGIPYSNPEQLEEIKFVQWLWWNDMGILGISWLDQWHWNAEPAKREKATHCRCIRSLHINSKISQIELMAFLASRQKVISFSLLSCSTQSSGHYEWNILNWIWNDTAVRRCVHKRNSSSTDMLFSSYRIDLSLCSGEISSCSVSSSEFHAKLWKYLENCNYSVCIENISKLQDVLAQSVSGSDSKLYIFNHHQDCECQGDHQLV